MDFGLPEQTMEYITNVMKVFSPITKAVIFGSRAKGNYKHNSDIDIAIFSKEDVSGKVQIMLDSLPTPYKYDVISYNHLNHEGLKDHINRVGIVFYETTDIKN